MEAAAFSAPRDHTSQREPGTLSRQAFDLEKSASAGITSPPTQSFVEAHPYMTMAGGAVLSAGLAGGLYALTHGRVQPGATVGRLFGKSEALSGEIAEGTARGATITESAFKHPSARSLAEPIAPVRESAAFGTPHSAGLTERLLGEPVQRSSSLRRYAAVPLLPLGALLAGCDDDDAKDNSQSMQPSPPISQADTDTKVTASLFKNPSDCASSGQYGEDECKAQFAEAVKEHKETAPAFTSQSQCEAETGKSCSGDNTPPVASESSTFVPPDSQNGQNAQNAPTDQTSQSASQGYVGGGGVVYWRPAMYGYMMGPTYYPGGYYDSSTSYHRSQPVYSSPSAGIVTSRGDSLGRSLGTKVEVPTTHFTPSGVPAVRPGSSSITSTTRGSFGGEVSSGAHSSGSIGGGAHGGGGAGM